MAILLTFYKESRGRCLRLSRHADQNLNGLERMVKGPSAFLLFFRAFHNGQKYCNHTGYY